MLDEFKSAFRRHNNAHVQLIIINVAVFVVLGTLGVFSNWLHFSEFFQMVWRQFALPSEFMIFLQRPWTLITYFFNHSNTDIFHILFNMLTLYWFGKLFVEYLGSDKLVALYFLGGLAGGIMYLLAYNAIPNPGFLVVSELVGASAAIFAVMVATAFLLPEYTFYLLFFGSVRIKYLVAALIFLSFLGTAYAGNAGGNIAHLGGALMGLIYIKQLQAGVNWGGWISMLIDWFRELFTPSRKVKVTYRKQDTPKNTTAPQTKASQAEIDGILDKISDRGYESLTKEEKEKLFNASKK